MPPKKQSILDMGARVVGSGVMSHAATRNRDFRIGWGRKDDEELPLRRDYRVSGALLGGVAAFAGKGNVARVGFDLAEACLTSVTQTEIARRNIEAHAAGKLEGVGAHDKDKDPAFALDS